MTAPEKLIIDTPEQIALEFPLAGAGSRFLALAIDTLLQLGAFLVLADTLARTVAAPQQLPVGVITALAGAPVFLYQLHRLRSA